MQKVVDNACHKKAFQELNYFFGDFYLFENFVIGEIKEDIVFNWEDHAKQVAEEIANLYEDNGKNIVYISNRVYRYSVIPSDWLRFFKYSYFLKGYAIVSRGKGSALERLFMKGKMRKFLDLDSAIAWAKELHGVPQENRDRHSA